MLCFTHRALKRARASIILAHKEQHQRALTSTLSRRQTSGSPEHHTVTFDEKRFDEKRSDEKRFDDDKLLDEKQEVSLASPFAVAAGGRSFSQYSVTGGMSLRRSTTSRHGPPDPETEKVCDGTLAAGCFVLAALACVF